MKTIGSSLIVLMTLLAAGCGGGAGTSGGTGGEIPSIANGLAFPEGTNALLVIKGVTSQPLAGISVPPPALTVQSESPAIEVTTALVGLREIELETLETADDEGIEFDLEGPFVVDLINNTVENLGSSRIDDDADDDGEEDAEDTDDDGDGVADEDDADDDDDGVADADDLVPDEINIFDALTLPTGTYQEIEAKLDRVEVEDGIDPASPLAGNSLFIEGTFDGQAFQVVADFDEEMEAESDEGIVVDDSSIASLVLSFNMKCWFQGIDLTGADTDSDGVVVLSNDINHDLFEQFRDQFKMCTEIENDEDGDGTPDSEDEDKDNDDLSDEDDADDDGDGISDEEDSDGDGDGIEDDEEAVDSDGDSDGIPDEEDLDEDNDGELDV